MLGKINSTEQRKYSHSKIVEHQLHSVNYEPENNIGDKENTEKKIILERKKKGGVLK